MTSEIKPRTRDDAPVTSSKTINPAVSLTAETVTINAPAQRLYEFWRDPVNLVHVMDNVTAVVPIDDKRSRWTVKAPTGQEISWVSEITEDVPGISITWHSAPHADVTNNGRIEFRQTPGRGTIVRAVIAYEPQGGKVGKLAAKLLQREPRIQARRDLHRFKQLMETGEIATGARNRRIAQEREGK